MPDDFLKQPKLTFDDNDFSLGMTEMPESFQRSKSHSQRFSVENQTFKKNDEIQKLKKNGE